MKMLLGVQRVLRQNVSHQLLIRKASFLDQFCKDDNNNKEKTDKPDKSVELILENTFKLYNLDDEPTDYVTLKQSEALKFYTDMQMIRRMENACAELYRQKVIRGFCHLYAGQEACCAGMWAAMRPEDTVITSYRSHGWTYLMGGSVYKIMAELAQKQTGCSRGKGGSMHTYAKNFYGGNGIVGSQVPLGAGVGLAHAYRCRDAVSFTLYGDGAANQGQLFESFNLACLWKLPVVFVCENNKYGMGTSANRAACNPNYYTRGDYIPGIWVNGMDVLAVRSATEFCIERAKKCGPLVMELETYRYYGHSMSDPGTSYRKREEIEQVRKTNDPITRFKTLCLNCKLLTEEDFKTIDDKVKKEIAGVVQEVTSAKLTDLNELTTDIYLVCYEKKIRDTVERNLEHKLVGKQYVPLGSPTPTPKSEIRDPPPPPQPQPPPKEPAKKDPKDAKPPPSPDDKATLPGDKSSPPPEIQSAPTEPDTPAKPKNGDEKSKIDNPSKE